MGPCVVSRDGLPNMSYLCLFVDLVNFSNHLYGETWRASCIFFVTILFVPEDFGCPSWQPSIFVSTLRTRCQLPNSRLLSKLAWSFVQREAWVSSSVFRNNLCAGGRRIHWLIDSRVFFWSTIGPMWPATHTVCFWFHRSGIKRSRQKAFEIECTDRQDWPYRGVRRQRVHSRGPCWSLEFVKAPQCLAASSASCKLGWVIMCSLLILNWRIIIVFFSENWVTAKFENHHPVFDV